MTVPVRLTEELSGNGKSLARKRTMILVSSGKYDAIDDAVVQPVIVKSASRATLSGAKRDMARKVSRRSSSSSAFDPKRMRLERWAVSQFMRDATRSGATPHRHTTRLVLEHDARRSECIANLIRAFEVLGLARAVTFIDRSFNASIIPVR